MRTFHDRRAFMTALTSLAGATAVQATAGAQAAPPRRADPAGPGLDWLEAFDAARHRQVYDLGGYDLSSGRNPLGSARAFLDGFRDEYGLAPPDIAVVVGISGPALPLNVEDRLWARYRLGERSRIVDPATRRPAVRNPFLTGTDDGHAAMRARGVRFWQCNVAVTNLSRRLAEETGMPAEEVRADIVAGLLPDVQLVPTHVMALCLAQERGFAYVKL